MKALLEFDVQEEEDVFRIASRAGALLSALVEYDNYLRHSVKYASDLTEEQRDVYGTCRAFFHECLAVQGIDLYSL